MKIIIILATLLATPVSAQMYAPNQSAAERCELKRQDSALRRELPDDATWDEIREHDLEKYRHSQAIKHELPDDATWDEILSKYPEDAVLIPWVQAADYCF